MEKNLYIDASHPNETRVVLKSGENIEDYEYEGLKNNLIKELKKPLDIKTEIKFGENTRFDFLIINKDSKAFVEVKNVTLSRKKKTNNLTK